MQFDYYYGKEADTFSFYRVPKILFSEAYFKGLSVEAKVLYGLMLDRMSLSIKNQWIDDEGKVYINFSVENIQEYMGCSKNKAVAILKELDSDGGIGLVEKKRLGQGKPTIIYVKNYASKEFLQNCNNWDSDQNGTVSEAQKINLLNPSKEETRGAKIGILESQKMGSNNTNINQTEFSETKSNLILSMENRMGRDEINAYAELIKENLELDLMLERNPFEQELIQGIYELILETVLTKGKTIVIASNEYPTEFVRSKFLKLNTSHLEYVVECFKSNTTKVVNIKKYLLATLFNAPSTISGYYQAEVNHDFPQYTMKRKGAM